MSYRCQKCKAHVPHGRQRLLHTLYRPKKDIFGQPTQHLEIAREIPVCLPCKEKLRASVQSPVS